MFKRSSYVYLWQAHAAQIAQLKAELETEKRINRVSKDANKNGMHAPSSQDELESRLLEIKKLQKENLTLRNEIAQMQEEFNRTKFMSSPSSRGDSDQTRFDSPSRGSASVDSDARQEKEIAEMERLRLERDVSRTRAMLVDALDACYESY